MIRAIPESLLTLRPGTGRTEDENHPTPSFPVEGEDKGRWEVADIRVITCAERCGFLKESE